MDFHLKQWKNHQDESEDEKKHYDQLQNQSEQEQEQPSAKIPKLLQNYPTGSTSTTSASAPPLSLFVPEQLHSNKISNLSAFPDSTTSPPVTTRFPRMGSAGGGGGYFSLAQWQELELQALIFKYMAAGASIPSELLVPIKKSLLHSHSYFLHHPIQHYSYYQPALLQSGYWGRGAMDPEPGRCRRTDGKKWRCSRDVVTGQKYCERHVHRGRNRSRKPVEIPTPNNSSSTAANTNSTSILGGGRSGGGSQGGGASMVPPPPLAGVTNGSSFSFSGQSSSTNLLHLNNSSSDSKHEIKGLLFGGPQTETANRSDGRVLRHFFDDWPKSVQEPDRAGNNTSPMNSATSLSISMPGNSSSDVSLKLATGNGGEEPAGSRGNNRELQSQVTWTGGWGTNQVSSMGGPLAEALRSSTSNSSPTSVLHQLPRNSASDTSYVST